MPSRAATAAAVEKALHQERLKTLERRQGELQAEVHGVRAGFESGAGSQDGGRGHQCRRRTPCSRRGQDDPEGAGMIKLVGFLLLLHYADPYNVAIAEHLQTSPVCALAAEVCTYIPIRI